MKKNLLSASLVTQMRIRIPAAITFFFFLIAIISSIQCGKKGNPAPELGVSATEISFLPEGGTSDLVVSANAQWNIVNMASWLEVSSTKGSGPKTSIKLTASPNTSGATRSVILTISADNGLAQRVSVSQPGRLYPSYNTSPKPADINGMESNAVQLAAKIKVGWNIGNTLEAIGGETAWGNPLISESYIKFVKQQGFNAIRLPCSWDQYSDKLTGKIDDNWMNRVKQVVQYCVNNDMYVLLNIHWDGGWLENNCTPAKQDSVNAKQKAFWEQIATAMRDFDEHLMFASANEPNADNPTNMAVLATYHQTFVDAVRSTGGRNTYRSLVVQGSPHYFKSMPADSTPKRLMYEDHNYTPSQFTFLNEDVSWGKMVYYWGEGNHSAIEPDRNPTYGEEPDLIAYYRQIKQQFIDKEIPVLLGEYGAYRRTTPKELDKHNASVDYWITFSTKQAVSNGLKPFFWDTGGALDRRNNTVRDQRTINAIMAGTK